MLLTRRMFLKLPVMAWLMTYLPNHAIANKQDQGMMIPMMVPTQITAPIVIMYENTVFIPLIEK